MAKKEEVLTKILSAIQQKTGGRVHVCSLCGQSNWILADRFIRLSAQKELQNISLGGEGFPFALLICANCGNTYFVNLLVLGLTNLSDLAIEEDAGGGT